MFSNIGKKIKVLALIIFIVEAAAAVITGIVIMATDEWLIPFGLLVMFAGPVVVWVLSWFLYGFGEIIDTLTAIERNTRGEQSVLFKSPVKASAPTPTRPPLQNSPTETIARTQRIEHLRAQGLITEEEYQQAISK